MFNLFTLVRTHWLLIVVVCFATWLRVYQLDTHAILFGDAGRDLLAAAQAVEERTVPLLGIPSSVPRFHQGPLTVWLEMIIFALVGFQLYPFSLVFAGLSLAAVIALYELVTVFISKRQGLLAAALLAASPLAVAHGRMVYHITPIPLVTVIFLWSLIRLAQQKPASLFWAVIAWCLLFQFELALLPLVLVIGWYAWRQGLVRQKSAWKEMGIGLLLGLWPQMLFDLTHGFKQLGGFAVWVAYRLLSAVSVVGDHAVGPSSIAQTARQLWLYGMRIVSVDQPVIWLIALGFLLVAAILSWRQWRQGKLPLLMEVSWLATIVLTIGFIIHSSPSEAYFPVFCVLLPLLLSYPLSSIPKAYGWLSVCLVAGWFGLMVLSISRHGWFVGSDTGFSYGPTLAEQRDLVTFTRQLTNDDFQFVTLQPGGAFNSYFDNLRWLAKEAGVAETETGIPVFIEPKHSPLSSYPTATKIELITRDVFVYE